MADIQGKHSVSGAQGRRQRAHASTRPAAKASKSNLPKPIVTRRGQTTVRRYPGRSFHRFEEAKGKTLDYVEFFTMGEYHCIDVCFEDNTAMHLVIEPSFTLGTEYTNWKSGDLRTIKRWPLVRSASFKS
jgi:hypothetical protein